MVDFDTITSRILTDFDVKKDLKEILEDDSSYAYA